MPTINDADAAGDRMPATWPIGGGGMGARIRAHDWSETPLGPSDAWHPGLRSAVDLLLGVRFPMMLMWGARLIQIYNDACAELDGRDSSYGLGQPYYEEHQFLGIDVAVLNRALRGETVTGSDALHPVMRQDRIAEAWFKTICSPARDDNGAVAGVLIVAFETTDYLLAERHLAGELQHRVRNSLSVVRSIARRTADASDDIESFAGHLDGRLGAFARGQAAVTSFPIAGVDLHTIIIDELDVYVIQEGDALKLSGPKINLRSKAAATLSLAFHELATNAVKFGALTVSGGSLAVSWKIDGAGDGKRLAIVWQERLPGATLIAPSHSGFGTELLERTLNYELDADVALEFNPSGLRCSIEVPFAANVVSGQARQ